MQLYSTPNIKDFFIQQHIDSPDKKHIGHFFTLQKMFDVLDVKSVYTDDLSSAVFIDNSELSKISLLAKCKFSLDFDFRGSNPTDKKLKSREFDHTRHTKHIVNSFDDLIDVLKEHNLKSTYAISQNIKKAQDKKRKEAFFSDISNMDRDFLSSKIVSIDFEYNPNTQAKNHISTVFEFGISVYDNNEIKYHHYLIEENYINKKTNPDLQHRFNFGESIVIKMDDAKEIFDFHMKNADYLLFHEFSADYNIMKYNGMGVEGKKIEILDTQAFFKKHFQEELNEPNPLSLKKLLGIFNLEGSNLHNSGNDAAYTLQTFFKMIEAYNNKNDIKSKNIQKVKYGAL